MAKPKKRTYSETEMRRAIKKAEIDTVERISNTMFGVWSMAMHDITGATGEEIKKAYERVCDIIVGLDTGDIKPNDVRYVLNDELGIQFKWK